MALFCGALCPAQKLHPGQTVEIFCPEKPGLCLKRTITQGGDITFPGAGWIAAADLTCGQLGNFLESLFKTSSYHFEVKRSPKPNEPVRFSGSVDSTSSISFRRGLTIKDVVVAAQPTLSADLNAIQVESADGRRYIVDYDVQPTFALKAGDEVVFGLNNTPRQVFVLGGVLKPGSYTWEPQITVADALKLAGGFQAYAYPERATVQRGTEVFPADDAIKLARGDIIRVPEADAKVTVVVNGNVAHPGVVKLGKGMRLSDAIRGAGGFSASADRRIVKYQQRGYGSYKVLNYMLVRAGTAADPVLQTGDVITVFTVGEKP